MTKTFINQFVRNLLKNRTISGINVLSLVIAFTSCLLIYSYVQNEFKYDKHFSQHEQLYRVASKVRLGGTDFSSSMAAPPLAKTLVREVPEVEKATRLWQWMLSVKRVNKEGESITYNEKYVTEADSNFFEVFNFELLQGDPKTCLKDRYAIVITEETALKYFGEEAYAEGEVMGESLDLKIFGRYRPYQIMGICENPPKQLHFNFDILFSSNGDPDSHTNHWLNNTYYTYALLGPKSDPKLVESKLESIVEKHVNQGYGKQFALNETAETDYWKYILQPITSIHLHSNYERELQANGSIRNIKIAVGIALMILIIALLNYINLCTFGTLRRSKEMAIRKISGMQRRNVLLGFITESVVFVLIAMVLSLLIGLLAIDFLEPISAGISHFKPFNEPLTYFLILFLILFSGVLGGIYPALKIIASKNINLLKSTFEKDKSGNGFRRVLAVSQFVIAIILIVSSIGVSRQLNYLIRKDPGFDQEHVLVCDAPVFALGQNFENFKATLESNPGIVSVSTANTVPGDGNFNFPLYLKKQGESSHQVVIPYEASYDFISTLGFEVLEGRDFGRNYDDQNNIILNETAVRVLGLDDPVGKYIYNSEVRSNNEQLTRLKIIGVVKDIHFESYHKKLRPFAIQLRNFHNYLVVRTKPQGLAQTIDFVKKSWIAAYPESPFSYTFLDKKFEALYHREAGMKTFVLVFTGLAIFIAVIGLFALSVFIAGQRTKEIGVRKVNGAKVREILTMLNKDFIKWVTIAFVIGCPIAWYAMHKWLENFAYKTSLSWWIFALAGVLALGIALLTVSWQSWRAATRNPVEALRYE